MVHLPKMAFISPCKQRPQIAQKRDTPSCNRNLAILFPLAALSGPGLLPLMGRGTAVASATPPVARQVGTAIGTRWSIGPLARGNSLEELRKFGSVVNLSRRVDVHVCFPNQPGHWNCALPSSSGLTIICTRCLHLPTMRGLYPVSRALARRC